MPKSHRKVYPVVTSTIVAITIASVAIRAAKPLLPHAPANRMVDESADFLQQGAFAQVDWRLMDKAIFEEAKETRKPILLLIGASWSRLARVADREVFTDPDVQALLRRDFLCVRIDVQDQPQWIGALLPLEASNQIRDPGFQVYFVDPDGQVFESMGRMGYGPSLNALEFSSALLGFQSRWDAYQQNRPEAVIPGEFQRQHTSRLLADPTNLTVDYESLHQIVVRLIRSDGQGLARDGVSRLHPNVLRFLLLRDDRAAFELAAAPCVSGGLVDWIDGGFFDQIRHDGRKETDFDKLSVTNAELMEVFALAYDRWKNPVHQRLAISAFDWLVSEMSPEGIPYPARIGDEVPGGRSQRSSVTVRQLRESARFQDLEFARQTMGLRSERFPMMTVRLRDPSSTHKQMAEFDRILEDLRKMRPPVPRKLQPRSCDVAAYVGARLIRTAAILKLPDLKVKAERIRNGVSVFGSGNDVRRKIDSNTPESPILADYLAFADMCLQQYLANRDLDALDSGSRVLERAAFLYNDIPGVWRSSQSQVSEIGLKIEWLPEVLDSIRESATGQVIRLNHGYSKAFEEIGRKAEGLTFINRARHARDQFADDWDELAIAGMGIYCASLELDRDDAHRSLQDARSERP